MHFIDFSIQLKKNQSIMKNVILLAFCLLIAMVSCKKESSPGKVVRAFTNETVYWNGQNYKLSIYIKYDNSNIYESIGDNYKLKEESFAIKVDLPGLMTMEKHFEYDKIGNVVILDEEFPTDYIIEFIKTFQPEAPTNENLPG